jgi:hypothetical protein
VGQRGTGHPDSGLFRNENSSGQRDNPYPEAPRPPAGQMPRFTLIGKAGPARGRPIHMPDNAILITDNENITCLVPYYGETRLSTMREAGDVPAEKK